MWAFAKKLGFSRKTLAHGSGLHYVYLGVLERGESNVSVLKLLKIISVLQITPSHLLGDELAEPQDSKHSNEEKLF